MDVVEESVEESGVERLCRALFADLPGDLSRLPLAELIGTVHERVPAPARPVEWPPPADPLDEALAAQWRAWE